MKRSLIVVATFCFFLVPSAAYACSCATGDPPVEFNRARAIFIGRMIGGTEKLSLKDGQGKDRRIEAGAVRFAVEEIFKGTVAQEATIEIASMSDTSCGPYGLKRGERYLVYAYAGEENADTLYSGVCTRTSTLDSPYVKEDLDFLRNLPPPGTGGNLSGRIWADLRTRGTTPLAHVKVNVRRSADNEVIAVVTDEEGRFELKRLKPGKYKVEPVFPQNYKGERDFAEVTIDDRGTAQVGFEAYINGRVSGRIFDKEGQSFNSIFLQLVAADKTVYGHATGEEGKFEVEGTPPGEYVLYLELQHADYKKHKPYYYPGTFNREEAAVIKVGLGETVEGLEFPLPDEFKVRTITGHVVWKDGQPASGVAVMLLCPQSAKRDGYHIEFTPTSAQTDAQGRFKLEAFTGETYWLEARGTKQEGNRDDSVEMHSPAKKITLSEHLKDVQIVLSENGFSKGCEK